MAILDRRDFSRCANALVFDDENDIFRIEIKGTGPRGAKRAIYNKIKQLVNKHAVYRTYDYKEAKKSSVFLEPIVLPNALVEVLIEN